MNSIVLLHPLDHVVIAIRAIEKGEAIQVGSRSIIARANIPAGHKIATERREIDQPVNKFGWSIGTATSMIEPGDHVHSHNLKCEHAIDLSAISTETPEPPAPITDYSFQGFRRPDGRVGTRNYVAIISNVNCSASVSKMIARKIR